MARWICTQGQVNLAKKAKACPKFDFTHKKSQIQIEKKNLFI